MHLHKPISNLIEYYLYLRIFLHVFPQSSPHPSLSPIPKVSVLCLLC